MKIGVKMKNSPLDKFGLTITQAAYWLDLEPKFLAAALDTTDYPQWLLYCLKALDKENLEDIEYFRLGAQLKENTWSSSTALAAIPILIEQAKKGEVISYKDLDAELRRRDPSREAAGTLQKYGKPLGMIGEVIEEIHDEANDDSSTVPLENAKMPPLEALVVRGREGLPGPGINGFLISYLRLKGERAPEDKMLLPEDRKAAIEEIHSSIFAWGDWSVLERLTKG